MPSGCLCKIKIRPASMGRQMCNAKMNFVFGSSDYSHLTGMQISVTNFSASLVMP